MSQIIRGALKKYHRQTVKIGFCLILATIAAFISVVVETPRSAYAACPAPSTDLGSVTHTVNVPTAGTYRVWSRMFAPSTSANSFMLEVDGGSCYVVGDNTGMAINSLVWVDYRDGTTATKINISLTQGNHTFKLIGQEPGVRVDRVILTSDLACVPTGVGDNCASPSDTTNPVVTLSFPGFTTPPADGAIVNNARKLTLAITSSDPGGGIASTTASINGTPATITNNQVVTPDANNDYAIAVRVTDTASNVTTRNFSTKIRHRDIGRNGKVDLQDLAILMQKWNKASTTSDLVNLDGLSIVNIQDLAFLMAAWGQTD